MTYLQTYLQSLEPIDGHEEFSRLTKASGQDRVIASYERVMRQAWEDRQEAERARIEREAPALVAFGFPPEEFVPLPWTGPLSTSFAEMAREWEAPIRARVERKRELMARAFTDLAPLIEELTA